MNLLRATDPEGLGKYAVLDLRVIDQTQGGARPGPRWAPEVDAALKTLEAAGALKLGRVGAPDEFFVMMLKDVNSPPALTSYAESAMANGAREYAAQVLRLRDRAARKSPYCKLPD